MTSPLLSRRTRTIAVFRALQLGDMLCAVPTLRAIRAAAPQAAITLAGLGWASAFARRYRAYIDDFVEFPGHPELPEKPADVRAFPRFLHEMQRRRLDLAVQLHGSGACVNGIVALFGAKATAGFAEPGSFCAHPGSYIPFPSTGHEISRLLSLARFLGAENISEELEFPALACDRVEWASLSRTYRLEPASFACVHPGARMKSRRWRAERFAAAADALARRGLKIVLTGSKEERGLVGEVRKAMKAPAVDLSGRTSLGGLALLIKNARLILCNDTGVSHVAAAVGTRSVVVIAGSDPSRWAPLDASRHFTASHPIACRPCAYDSCPIGQLCSERVSAERVIGRIGTLLAEGSCAR